MVICAVFGCNSSNDKRLKRNQSNDIEKNKFFRFPKDEKIQKVWLFKCGRKDKFNVQNAFICSRHFTPDQYLRNLMHEMLKYSPKNSKKLKSDAVPTVNLPLSSADSKSKRQERKNRREAKQTVQEILSFADAPGPENLQELSTGVDIQYAPEEGYVSKIDKSTNTEDSKETLTSTHELMDELIQQNESLIAKVQMLQQESKYMDNIFTPGQRRKLQANGKRIKWEVNDISSAIAIYSSGPKAYRLLLKRNYPLPAVTTLRTWASKVNINPGYLSSVFALMRNVNLSTFQKVCVLMADEMKIQKSYEYDTKSDTLLAPANYVQVVMARGLFENWKQPVFYNYDCALTKEMFKTIIKKLQSMDYNVVGVVSDLGGGNRGLWRRMGISETQPFFLNPSNKEKKVYVLSDTPHLIKLLRNHFLDTGVFLHGKHLTKEPLEELLAKQSNLDLKISSRLTPTHLNVKAAKRQKVKFATQLFSHTNACALTRLGTLGLAKSKYWNELAVLCKEVNDWFDIFHTRIPRIDSRPRMAAFGLELEHQDQILTQIESTMRTMRVGNHKLLIPFQEGILTNISALRMMFKDLQQEYQISYLLTYRLNQDPLEMFFGVMRAKGGLYDHPTALQFKYRLRRYILGRNESIVSQSANVESTSNGCE